MKIMKNTTLKSKLQKITISTRSARTFKRRIPGCIKHYFMPIFARGLPEQGQERFQEIRKPYIVLHS